MDTVYLKQDNIRHPKTFHIMGRVVFQLAYNVLPVFLMLALMGHLSLQASTLIEKHREANDNNTVVLSDPQKSEAI